MRHQFKTLVTLAALVAALAMPPTPFANAWTSRDPTTTLIEGLRARQLKAVAVRGPDVADQFVEALLLPGQPVVVSATHLGLFAEQVTHAEYRDAYIDLQATPRHDSTFSEHDLDSTVRISSATGHSISSPSAGSDSSVTTTGQWSRSGARSAPSEATPPILATRALVALTAPSAYRVRADG